MSRCSSTLLALLLLSSSPALSKDKAPAKPAAAPDMPVDLQLIGWSKDEKRFAIRAYDLSDADSNDLDEPPPYCPGYVDHRGKKFRGSLSMQLYEGSQQSKTWAIQELSPCTPPEKARERLTEAKAALAQQDIDLSAVGTVVVPRKGAKPFSRRKGKTLFLTSRTLLVLPSGPWARQTVEVSYRGEEQDTRSEKNDATFPVTSRATFTVSLRSGKKPTRLAEFPLGPSKWSRLMAGHWTPTVDRLVLSPSGKHFVLLGHLSDGDTRSGSESSFLFGLVELPELAESASLSSAQAR